MLGFRPAHDYVGELGVRTQHGRVSIPHFVVNPVMPFPGPPPVHAVGRPENVSLVLIISLGAGADEHCPWFILMIRFVHDVRGGRAPRVWPELQDDIRFFSVVTPEHIEFRPSPVDPVVGNDHADREDDLGIFGRVEGDIPRFPDVFPRVLVDSPQVRHAVAFPGRADRVQRVLEVLDGLVNHALEAVRVIDNLFVEEQLGKAGVDFGAARCGSCHGAKFLFLVTV